MSKPRIVSPVAYLFRAEGDDLSPLSLHFVSTQGSATPHEFWTLPDMTGMTSQQAFLAADAFGKRSAAAYAIFLQRTGPDALPLLWILQSMFAPDRTLDGSEAAFLRQLTRLLSIALQQHSPAELAADAETEIDATRAVLKADQRGQQTTKEGAR